MTFSNTAATSSQSAFLPSDLSPMRRQSSLKKIFIGPEGLRAGWRLLIFAALVFVLLAAFALIRNGGVNGLREAQRHAGEITVTPFSMGWVEATAFVLICVATLIMGRIERRKFSDYGLPVSLFLREDFWSGAIWGFAAISGTLLAIFLLSGFSITGLALHGMAIPSAMLAWGAACIMVGLFEEFLCRGYIQRTLGSAIGFWPAALVMSFLFGFTHAFNPNETKVGAVSAGLFGLLFCLFLLRKGNLWAAVGFHAAWDWGQTFYGVADSGIVPYHNVFQSSFHGPLWLTGGSVGPEASIFTPVALLVVALLFVCFHRENASAPGHD